MTKKKIKYGPIKGKLIDERNMLSSIAKDSKDANAFALGILIEPILKGFVKRNFNDDARELLKWSEENTEERIVVKTSGRLEVDIDELEYVLGKNESIQDINWENVANDYIADGYGYSEFSEDEVQTYEELFFDSSNLEKLTTGE